MMQKFKLDFSIYSSKDRLEAIKSIPLETLTKSELETITNYVLYGKDEDGTSSVDRKEIQIKTKFNSYRKDKDKITSLDALMESPTFDESSFSSSPTHWKNVKPTIDKEKDKDIPNMRELWTEIERLSTIQKQNEGKEPRQPNCPELTPTQLYYLNHLLIELRTQQYYLVDSVRPTIFAKKNKAQFHPSPVQDQLNFPILPRGLFHHKDDFYFQNPHEDKSEISAATPNEDKILEGNKPYLDFRKEEHLYWMIQFYKEIEAAAQYHPDSILWNLLWTLDFYIEKAGLSPQQRLIVELKKNQTPNKQICEELQSQLGISHRENYISTIWNKAVRKIKDAVELNYDEWLCKDYEKAWKQCSRCGKWYLRDPRNFVRKAKALDGLTGRCKKCDKELRG